jgi:hypothetical protein
MTLSGKPHSGELISVIALVIPQWNFSSSAITGSAKEGKTPPAVGTDFRLEPENIPSQNLNFGASSRRQAGFGISQPLRSHRFRGNYEIDARFAWSSPQYHACRYPAEVYQQSGIDGLAAGRRPEACSRAGKTKSGRERRRYLGVQGSAICIRGALNYQVSNDGQHALTMAKSYAHNFGSGFTSFIFSGSCGTGKNHLAAAIGNYLLQRDHSVLVVTVPDLMLRARKCYDEGQSESALLDDLCKVDLLVLDEVGVQRETRNEWVLLNQI